MKVGIIAFSEKGSLLGTQLQRYFTQSGDCAEWHRCQRGELAQWTEAHFHEDDALVFISAAGIAVRAVAPFLKSKMTDPAVVVVDEAGTYCISLLSGHIGGANDLTKTLGRWLKAIPVVTTATDVSDVFAVDSWAKAEHLTIANPGRIKDISAGILAGKTIRLASDFPVRGRLPEGCVLSDPAEGCDGYITWHGWKDPEALLLIAPVVTLGIGCKKGVGADEIESFFQQICTKANCHPSAVKGVCSVDKKAGEKGICEFCSRHALPFKTFSPEQLRTLPGQFTGSEFVASITGVDNICERSAVLGAGDNGRLISFKTVAHGITMALALEPYTVCFEEEFHQ